MRELKNDEYVKGHKNRIYPTKHQKEIIDSYFNYTRFVYNWAKEQEEKQYIGYINGEKEKAFLSFKELSMIFTKYRNTSGNEWLLQYKVGPAREAIKNLVENYKKFFNKCNKNKPAFKKKGKCKKSYGVRNDKCYIEGNGLRIEGLKYGEKINLNYNTGYTKDSELFAIRISQDYLGDYYVSYETIEKKIELTIQQTEPLGIDMGKRNTLTFSRPINGSNFYHEPVEDIARLEIGARNIQRKISRDQRRRIEEAKRTRTKYEDIPKSKNEIKREIKYRKKKMKIHNKKKNRYDNIAKQIVLQNPKGIVMEDFSIMDLRRNSPYAAKSMNGIWFGYLENRIQIDCNKYNIPFMKADRYYPSSKICSCCGSIQNIDRHEKIYKCKSCGYVLDRDINASYNLEDLIYNQKNNSAIPYIPKIMAKLVL